MSLYDIALFLIAVAAGAVASVAGFGIGSLVTPALAISVGTQVAVTLVAIPHLVATGYRMWLLRRDIDRAVLLVFGLASAAGGLVGAILHAYLASPVLTVVLGALLVLAGVSELFGLARRVVLAGWVATAAGAVSGLFGGLVGNQGGIRAAALLRFNLAGPALVATSTATGVMVDLARLPVYLATGWEAIAANAGIVVGLSIAVLVGTVVGTPILRRLPERSFRRMLAVLLMGLGVLLILIAGLQLAGA